MKKIISALLLLAMVLSLCACGTSGDSNEGKMEGLNVGFGRETITPDFSVGLGGYSDNETRKSESVLDYIYATCIAVTEGDQTILIYTLDSLAAAQTTVDKVRDLVSPATGVPADHIYVLATHTHSAPSLFNSGDEDAQYEALFYNAIQVAGEQAMADRAPATMSVGTTTIEGMNFIRHYLLENGTYAGPSFGDFNSAPIKEHVGTNDPRMNLLKFDRTDESKQDIVMMNWQAHPASAGTNGYNNISADFIGGLRSKFERETKMLLAYFTGASGNQVVNSKILSEKHQFKPKQYGEELAKHAIEALPKLQSVEGTAIKTTTFNFDAEIDHSWDNMLSQANEIYDLWKATDLDTGNAAAKKYDFTSVYQARAIRTRAAKPATETMVLNSFSIGNVGFVTGVYEMFSEQGIYIRDNSPFPVTFVLTGNSGYIPTAAAYDYRSYESDTGMYAKGTAEKLAEKYVEMLNGLK